MLVLPEINFLHLILPVTLLLVGGWMTPTPSQGPPIPQGAGGWWVMTMTMAGGVGEDPEPGTYIPGPSKKCQMDNSRCQPPLGGCWYIPLRQFPKPNKECVCFCTFFSQDDPCKGFPSTKGPKLWYTDTNICFAVQSRHADFDEGI